MKPILIGVFALVSVNLHAQYTSIPDANFESQLVIQGYDTLPLDGQVLTANINTITLLDLSSKNISDLTGIEDITALQDLDLGNNNLSYLDVSQNTNLRRLWALYNPLTCINLRNGANQNMVLFHAYQCPNLTCIQVDDAAYSDTTWVGMTPNPGFGYNFDSISYFGEYCESCNVGLTETNQISPTIYPNPISTQLTITSAESILELTIFDLAGKVIYSDINIGFATEITTENWKNGMYFVQMTLEDQRIVLEKLIKTDAPK